MLYLHLHRHLQYDSPQLKEEVGGLEATKNIRTYNSLPPYCLIVVVTIVVLVVVTVVAAAAAAVVVVAIVNNSSK